MRLSSVIRHTALTDASLCSARIKNNSHGALPELAFRARQGLDGRADALQTGTSTVPFSKRSPSGTGHVAAGAMSRGPPLRSESDTKCRACRSSESWRHYGRQRRKGRVPDHDRRSACAGVRGPIPPPSGFAPQRGNYCRLLPSSSSSVLCRPLPSLVPASLPSMEWNEFLVFPSALATCKRKPSSAESGD